MEGFRINGEAVDQITLAEKGAEGFQHQDFHIGDVTADDAGAELGEGFADLLGMAEHPVTVVFGHQGVDVAIPKAVKPGMKKRWISSSVAGVPAMAGC